MEIKEFITPDKRHLILVPYFLKKFYKKYKYHELSKNIVIKKLSIILNIKIIGKIKAFLRIIIQSSIFFHKPDNYDFLIFDKEQSEPVKKLLPSKNFKVINNRIDHINEIYLTYEIIYFMLKNLFYRSLRLNYLIALIICIKPKTIITYNDHLSDFHMIARHFKNSKIKFVAIQQAGRVKANANKKVYIPYFFTFGKYEKDLFKRNCEKNHKFFPIGSLKLSMALEFFKKKKIDFGKNNYDICVISEPRRFLNRDFPGRNDMNENRALIFKHAINYCEKFKKRIIISGKSDIREKKNKECEYIIYKHYLDNLNFKICFNNKNDYGSYLNMLNSKIVIGSKSTMLQEALGIGKKVLYCDYENDPSLFPKVDEICVLKDKSYRAFEKKVHMILKMGKNDYLRNTKSSREYVYNHKADTIDSIKKFLKI